MTRKSFFVSVERVPGVAAMVRIPLAICLLILACAVPGRAAWKLVWSDEFNGAVNAVPDRSKWTYDLGNNNGWGNHELERYTDRPENAHMDGEGNLVIRVESSSAGYTSARLKTQGLFSTQYGRIETRAKLPSGSGLWPAFWMLGADISTVGWPQCGEIDIMEARGSEPDTNHGSVHGPGYSGGGARSAVYRLPAGSFQSGFHRFAIEWSAGEIAFSVDGSTYSRVSRASLPQAARWVFDHPFFLILNVAVGGDFAGPLGADTVFPQEMLVDYVRVYQSTDDPGPMVYDAGVVDAVSWGPTLAAGGVASLFGAGLGAAAVVDTFDTTTGEFRRAVRGSSVLVNGVAAPLTYMSPKQINFQVPWATPSGVPVNVEVMRDGLLGNARAVLVAAAAPAVFHAGGAALLSCVGSPPGGDSVCTLWGNGFGPTVPAPRDGVPFGISSLSETAGLCKLVVGGVEAAVTFCGGAPGLLIDQLNFVFPKSAALEGRSARAVLTVNGAGTTFLLLTE